MSLVEVEVVGRAPHDVGVGGLILEEAVDESSQFAVLTGRELAVLVATNARVSHVVGDTESLVDLLANLHAAVGGHVAEPLHVDVLGDVETTGGNQTSKQVVVEREGRNAVNVLFEGPGEPDVLSNDLRSSLDVLATCLLGIRETPASSATRAGLLRNGKSNAINESTSDDGTLAVTGATSDGNPLSVDVVTRGSFESINDTIDTPSPGSKSGSGVAAAIEIVELAATPAASVLLIGNFVVVEGDGSNAVVGNAEGAIGNDGGVGAGSRRSADGDLERNGLAALGNVDGKPSTGVGTSDGLRLGREGTELIALEELENFPPTALPIGLGGNLGAADESERIREVSIVEGYAAGEVGASAGGRRRASGSRVDRSGCLDWRRGRWRGSLSSRLRCWV